MSLPLPPGPRGLDNVRFVLGTASDFMKPLCQMASEYGDVAATQARGRLIVSISSAEAARHILVTNQDNYGKGIEYELLRIVLGEGLLTSEGEVWRRQRKLVQPMFAKRHLNHFTEHMTAATADALDGPLMSSLTDGQIVDANRMMMELTLDIVGRALFGADLSGATAARVGPAMNDVLTLGTRMARRLPTYVASMLPGMNLRRALSLNPEGRRFQRSLDELKKVIDEVLRERAALGDNGDDLLGLLLSARDEETGESMSRDQIGDELMTFMLAGHETTSNALSWTWGHLSLNPSARARLFDEVDSVLGDRVPTMEDVDLLPWTRACVEEAMRITPPVWMVGRKSLVDDEINGYRIPAGSSLMVLITMIHRDPKLWPNPEGFDPERFLPENARGRTRQAYMPFGAGRRICVGSTFAIIEATLLAAMISRRLAFDLPRGAVLEVDASITQRPRDGLPMSVHHREPAKSSYGGGRSVESAAPA
ncbi:MAG: cytochrome P450 [Solirubrobacterales bacterium]